MKKFLAIICLLVVATSAEAAFDLTGWRWQRPIDAQKLSGFVRLTMTPDIFDESQAGLGDLRVMDEGNKLVPHVIHWGRVEETQQPEWQPARLLNPTFLPGKYARAIVDFGEKVEKNSVTVSLPGQNYRRRALLEGSDDSTVWDVVAEEVWFFDVSLQGHNFKIDTVKFPTNNFRYLRLTVYNMPDDPRRITIDGVKCALRRTGTEKEWVPVPVKRTTLSHDENKHHTVFDLDLGYRNLPVVSLEFEITTPFFNRGCELLGRNESKERVPQKTETKWDTVEQEVPWKSLHRGVLYRMHHKNKTIESLKMEGLHAPYRHLQLRIFNEDNPPLKLEGVSVYRRDGSLVFQVEPGQRYTLIGGNPKAMGARYDLSKAIQGIDGFTLPAVGAGSPAAIAHKEQLPPWSERHGTFIWIVLVLAVAAMVFFIVKNLKKLPASDERQ